jgi:chromosome partitioning protein
MSVITFVNQKGGCGKSTSAVHFAYFLKRSGKSVLLVDADAQRSSSFWLESMDDPIRSAVVQSPDELLEQIPELNAECDYLVVDGPAGLAEPTRAILFRADLAVIPCKPTGLDSHSAFEAVRLIRQAQSVRQGPPKAALFLSQAVKGTKLKDEAISLLSKTKEVAPLLKTTIHQKQAIADAFGQSATVWDLPGRPAAESRREYERLFKEIMSLLP